MFFFYGTGANGKSVLLSTIAGILGDYHKTAAIETFTVQAGAGRTAAYRRFKDILQNIEGNLGGLASMSEGHCQLARRAATLAFTAEAMESAAVAGMAFDIDLFGQLTDRLGRCFQRLGLKRVSRTIGPSIGSVVAAIRRSKQSAGDE